MHSRLSTNKSHEPTILLCSQSPCNTNLEGGMSQNTVIFLHSCPEIRTRPQSVVLYESDKGRVTPCPASPEHQILIKDKQNPKHHKGIRYQVSGIRYHDIVTFFFIMDNGQWTMDTSLLRYRRQQHQNDSSSTHIQRRKRGGEEYIQPNQKLCNLIGLP